MPRYERMERLYTSIAAAQLSEGKEMLFLSGPRQVGKTTVAEHLQAHWGPSHRLNWDVEQERATVLRGAQAIVDAAPAPQLGKPPPLLCLDELHKYRRWRQLLKGLFDRHGATHRIVVTGSAKLDVFRRGGDSLLGRYFPYRLHPLSVAELTTPARRWDTPIGAPSKPDPVHWDALQRFGGFPAPLARQDLRFLQRWRRLRRNLLIREDLHDLSKVEDLAQVEVLATLLEAWAGQALSYSRIAQEIGAPVSTARRWVKLLEALYYCYLIRPWFRNIARSLRKEPKVYLWDWSGIRDKGARFENFVASQLLKATHFWSDHGLGEFELRYLRDKGQREVDFLLVRDGQPWCLIEVKSSGSAPLSPNLRFFQQQLQAPYALQIAADLEFVAEDPFARPPSTKDMRPPLVVPAQTLLSQLV